MLFSKKRMKISKRKPLKRVYPTKKYGKWNWASAWFVEQRQGQRNLGASQERSSVRRNLVGIWYTYQHCSRQHERDAEQRSEEKYRPYVFTWGYDYFYLSSFDFFEKRIILPSFSLTDFHKHRNIVWTLWIRK